jgi:hypothetical protein
LSVPASTSKLCRALSVSQRLLSAIPHPIR